MGKTIRKKPFFLNTTDFICYTIIVKLDNLETVIDIYGEKHLSYYW